MGQHVRGGQITVAHNIFNSTINKDQLIKGEIGDAFSGYGDKNELRFPKTGKSIREALEQKLFTIQLQKNAIEQFINAAEGSINAPMKISNYCNYSEEINTMCDCSLMIFIPSQERINNPTNLNSFTPDDNDKYSDDQYEFMINYNEQVYKIIDLCNTILTINAMARNIDPNGTYNLNINQLKVLGL